VPVLGFLGLSVLELGQARGMQQKDGQTDTGHHFIMTLPNPYGGRGHNKDISMSCYFYVMV